jgi:glycerol-3-phosphate acyltransferase PlsY
VTTNWGGLVLVAVGSYALGCVSTAYYLVRLRTGTDVRTQASGTAGATNAGRLLGGWAYALVALLDLAKGAVAVGLAGWLAAGPAAPVALVAAVAGHIWPVQLRFRGGKGVATIFGGVLVLAPVVALMALGVALVLLAATRKYHASGKIAIALAPAIGWWCGLEPMSLAGLVLAVAIVLLVHYTRRSRPDGAEPG